MDKQTLYDRLDPKLDQIADMAIRDHNMIDLFFNGLSEDNAKIKYGCSNILIMISRKDPGILYPYFDRFEQLLDHENKFVKRAAIIAIAYLTKVDQEKRFEKISGKYFSEMTGPDVTSASYTIRGVSAIAGNKPHLTEQITNELLKIQHAKYQTKGCRDVALGFMIVSFDKFFDQVKNKQEVIDLIGKQTDNPRKATRNHAEKFMKKWVR